MSWRIDLEFIEPGKNTDGYWKSEDMILHVIFFLKRREEILRKLYQYLNNCIQTVSDYLPLIKVLTILLYQKKMLSLHPK